MYNKLVAKEKDVFATPLFILSITIPLFLAVLIGVCLHYSDDFTKLLSHIWLTMKLPLAIASLSIPLATWVIANHRSAQITKSNKLQASKRLVETYLEQENFFERVYGRKITTAKWSFITREDLPVIHAELYEFQKIQEKGEIKLKDNIADDVSTYFKGTHKVFWDYYEIFIKEKENENNEFLLESFTVQLFEYLHDNLANFSMIFGTQNVSINETCLSSYISAYFEIHQLCIDLKINTGNTNDETLRDDYETFNAVATLIYDNYNLRLDDATLAKFEENIGIKKLIKFTTAKPHIQTINRLLNDWAEKFIDNFEYLRVLPIEGEYLSFKLFSKNKTEFILMSFIETDEQEYFGEIQLTKNNDKVYMPIYKTDTGIKLNKDAPSAESTISEMLAFITKYYTSVNQ